MNLYNQKTRPTRPSNPSSKPEIGTHRSPVRIEEPRSPVKTQEKKD